MRPWFWRRKAREAELDEEVRAHLDMAAQTAIERGAAQKEAERAARHPSRWLSARPCPNGPALPRREVRAHLDMAAQTAIERGAAQKEAERAARREFGNMGLMKEVTRDVWGWRWLEDVVEDVLYGLR